ncbi:MAG: hypothetical protein WDN72_06045 [Alphaproteobacteria bacterium]
MYQLVRPKIAVPVHGEARHIHEHAKLARTLQVPVAIEPVNGMVINLTDAKPGSVGSVTSGYLAMDGTSLIDSNSPVIRMRRKLRDDGMCIASIVLRRSGELAAPPYIVAPGCLDEHEDKELIAAMREDIAAMIDGARKKGARKSLEESVRVILRKHIRDELGKKPVLDVHIHQV